MTRTRQTRESVEAFVQQNVDDPRAILFGIFVQDHLVGTSRVHEINSETPPPSAFIGLAIFDRREWGNGLGTRAMRAVIDFCHDRLRLDVVRGIADRQHEISRAMLRRTGYVHNPGADREADGTVMELWERARPHHGA